MAQESSIQFGLRLKQARLANKLSMDALAEKTNGEVSKQAISKYENGKMKPSLPVVACLSDALAVDEEYFYRPITIDFENLGLSFRKRSSMGAKESKALTISIQDDIERYIEVADILGISAPSTISLSVDEQLSTNLQMEKYAIQLRDLWGLGKQPISSVQDLLESKGIMVLYHEGPNSFDGVSGIVNSTNYVMVLNDNINMVERRRFTAMHELGHLLFNSYFDKSLSNLEKEKLCHAFASEMLIPYSILEERFDGKTKIAINELEFTQEQYGISIDAILHKLNQKKLFGDKRYRSYQIRKNTTPALKERVEKSRFSETKTPIFEAMVYKALAAELVTESKAASLLHLSINEVHNNFALL